MTSQNSPNHFAGLLRLNPSNPRYLTDGSGRMVYLTGSHTWADFQDIYSNERDVFYYNSYLDFMQASTTSGSEDIRPD